MQKNPQFNVFSLRIVLIVQCQEIDFEAFSLIFFKFYRTQISRYPPPKRIKNTFFLTMPYVFRNMWITKNKNKKKSPEIFSSLSLFSMKFLMQLWKSQEILKMYGNSYNIRIFTPNKVFFRYLIDQSLNKLKIEKYCL